MADKEFIIFDKRETLLQSWAKDSFTFGFVLLCIYVSQGSPWWTFVTGFLFLLFIAVKSSCIVNKKQKTLKGKSEAILWAKSLEDE